MALEGKLKRRNNRGRPEIIWEKDMEDWMGKSVWRVGGTAEDQLMYRSLVSKLIKQARYTTMRNYSIVREIRVIAQFNDTR